MEFVIAFLGILIIIFKGAWDSSTKTLYEQNFNKTYENEQLEFIKWKSLVTDQALEDSVNKKIDYYSDENLHTDFLQACKELSSVVQDITGVTFDSVTEFFNFVKKLTPMSVKRIYMGMQGKLMACDAEVGIPSPPVYNDEAREAWEYNHKIMLWLGEKIKAATSYDIKYVNSGFYRICKYHKEHILNMSDVTNKSSGRYCWEPMIPNMSLFAI